MNKTYQPVEYIKTKTSKQFLINEFNENELYYFINNSDYVYNPVSWDVETDQVLRHCVFILGKDNYFYALNSWLSTGIIQAFISAIDSNCDSIEFIIDVPDNLKNDLLQLEKERI